MYSISHLMTIHFILLIVFLFHLLVHFEVWNIANSFVMLRAVVTKVFQHLVRAMKRFGYIAHFTSKQCFAC